MTNKNYFNQKLTQKMLAFFFTFITCGLMSFNAMAQCVQPGGPYQVFESFSASLPTQGGTWSSTSLTFGTTASNIRTGSHYAIFNALGDIVRTPQIANPGVFTFWYSRSGTTTGVPQFTIETSPDNSTWTVRGTVSTFTAAYQKFTLDIGALGLTNVYVRVRDTRASGTAERYIDDMAWTSTVGGNNTITSNLGAGTVTVGSLPYSATGQNTCGNGNNITSINGAIICGSGSYYGGEDKTYIFTPTSTGVHPILVTTTTDDDCGITLYQGCPLNGGTCVGFTQNTGPGLTRAINASLTNGVTYYLVVDNFPSPACITGFSVTIDPPAACPTPTAVTAGSITATTASISWTCTGCTGTFELDYGANPHTAGTGTIITGVTSPYTLNPPLAPSTGYQVFVRQNCTGGGNGFSTWSTGATFTTLAPPPANDQCAGAIVIPAAGPFPYATGATDLLNATTTNDPGVPTCQSSVSRSVWYQFTPNVSGSFIISSCQSDNALSTRTDDVIAIYTATSPCTGPYTEVACDDDACTTLSAQSIITATLTSGTTYYIVVWSFGTSTPTPSNVALLITAPVACPTPTAVAAGSVTSTTASISWTCSGCTGSFELDYGANPHTAGTGTIITSGVTSPYTLNPPLTPSTNYQVFVRQNCGGGSFSNWSTGATFTTLAPPPANDQCAGAIVIPAAGPFPYSTGATDLANATTTNDPGVPTCQSDVSRSVWYQFTPNVSGSFVISSCQSDNALSTRSDIILAVYTATSPCTGPYTSVACDDDGCTTLNFQSIITTNLTAGTTYYIVAWSYGTTAPSPSNVALKITAPIACPIPTAVTAGSITQTTASITWTCTGCTGTYQLDWGANGHTAGTGTIITGVTSPYTLNPPLSASTPYTVYIQQDCSGGGNGLSGWSTGANFTTLAPPPANDDCAGAIALAVNPTCITTAGNGASATQSMAAILCDGFTGNSDDDMWYSFVASNTTATITVDGGSDYDAVVELLSGACNGTSVSCADATTADGIETINATGLTIGATYYVRTYDYGTGSGSFTICVTGTCAAPTAYAVTGGGSYCAQETAPSVGLANSEVGFNYQLFRGATPLATLPGTAAALNFGAQATAGTYTVTATNSGDAACNATMTGNAVVTIVPLPTANITSANETICTGGSVNITGTVTSTAAWDLYLSDDNINPATSGAGGTNVAWSVSRSLAATYTITLVEQNVGLGCSTDPNGTAGLTGSTTITVNAVPVSGSLTPSPAVGTICSGSTVSATATNGTGGAGTIVDELEVDLSGGGYNAYVSGTAINTAGETSITIRTRRTATGSGCTASSYNTVSWTISAQPVAGSLTPTPAAGPVCTGGNVSAAAGSGTGGAGTVVDELEVDLSGGGYNPYVSGTNIPTAGESTITIRTRRTADGTNCSNSSYNTVSWTVNPLPAATLSGSSSGCNNGTQNATVTLDFTAGSAPWSYDLFDGTNHVTGSTSSDPASIVINCTGFSVGTHTFSVFSLSDNNNCSGSGSGSATVAVAAGPPGNAIVSVNVPAFACNGEQDILATATVQNVPAGSWYSWNTGSNSSVVQYSLTAGGPYSNGPFITPTAQVYVKFGALGNSSGYNVCVQAVNGCGSSNNKCQWIQGSTSTPATITGNTVVCSGGNGNYSASTVTPASAVYTWTFSVVGATFQNQGQANVGTVTFPAFTSGQLCVTSKLSCTGAVASPARCITISNSTASIGTMTGSNRVCPGATGEVYTVPVVTGATYNWTVPPGASITSPSPSTSNSITVTFPNPYTSSGYSVCVTATSICGITTSNRCVTVSSKTPGTPASISGPLAGLCGQHVVYTSAVPSGVYTGYSWGGTVLSPTPAAGITNVTYNGQSVEFDVAAPFTGGTLTVTGDNHTCTPTTSSAPRSISISSAPVKPTNITPTAICLNFPVTFTATPVPPAGTTYQWYFSSGTLSDPNPNNTGSMSGIWGAAASGTVQVTAKNNCGNSSTLVKSVSAVTCREAGTGIAASSFSAYPNPAHDNITLSITAKEQSNYTVKLMDLAGRVVVTESMQAIAGSNDYQMDLTTLPKGVYMLQVQSVNDNWNTRVVVQ